MIEPWVRMLFSAGECLPDNSKVRHQNEGQMEHFGIKHDWKNIFKKIRSPKKMRLLLGRRKGIL